MTSALAALANATVAFSLPTTGTEIDQLTGNVKPQTEEVEVSLYLRQGSINDTDLPGIDAAAVVYEGYAVNPQALDARVKKGVQGTIEFSGSEEQRCEVVAAAFPYGTQGLLGSTLQQVLGDRIRLVAYIQH